MSHPERNRFKVPTPVALTRVIAHCERQKAQDMAYWDQIIQIYRDRLQGLGTGD